ncbi:spodomicin-like [Leguminivora glycinivorella]|uniref:spodomicin-like n=1 Tax=Leguminivora glycinivorella TaxID=1035111 RepID=UPI00200F266C|nr:spodomicin-like [Leguminivora glycinivorella]
MAALKTLLILVVLAVVMATAIAVRVGPCDQVCDRIPAERDECCRAHGYNSASCSGGRMDCF